jgi:hypothetical protein
MLAGAGAAISVIKNSDGFADFPRSSATYTTLDDAVARDSCNGDGNM